MPTMSRPLLLSLCVSFGLGVGVASAQPAAPVDPATLGPQVGEIVPAFSLPDQHGAVQTSRSLMGPKGMMLVFSRATAW